MRSRRQSVKRGAMALPAGAHPTRAQLKFVVGIAADPRSSPDRARNAGAVLPPLMGRPQLFPHLGQRVLGLASPRVTRPVNFSAVNVEFGDHVRGGCAEPSPSRFVISPSHDPQSRSEHVQEVGPGVQARGN
jgi:hypothetical protein